MDDFVLLDGDQASFLPHFGTAVVVVRPVALKGSGPCTLNGKKVCVVGDEAAVSVPGCTYSTPQYSIPGTGTLKISALAGDQKSTQTTTGGRAPLLKGSKFTASFEVQNPAKQPPPGPGAPIPDPTPRYVGQGEFVTTNGALKTG